jgi:plastocyanin
MALPPAVKGVIITIPNEGHHPASEGLAFSSKNPHYLPANLVVPSGTSIAFVHGDVGHEHVGTVSDSKSGTVAWRTTAVGHPGGSDVKVLPAGTYDVTDEEYPDMKGTITVSNDVISAGNLVVGGLFVPTPSLEKYKTNFANAGFSVLSTYNFTSESEQKDMSGSTTLVIYSTATPIDKAMPKLFPIIKSLPYK